MRRNLGTIVFALAVGYTLAHFGAAFYNHWYFAANFWLKVGLLTPLLAAVYGVALRGALRPILRGLGVWWIITHLLALVSAGGADLRNMAFVAVLDYEVVVVWLPGIILTAYFLFTAAGKQRERDAAERRTSSELRLRRRLRQHHSRTASQPVTVSLRETNNVQ